MWTGFITLVVAAVAAGWLLFRLAGNQEGDGRKSVAILKIVVLLALTAALFAAKLWPLAFMVLVGAGGVMAIESWRAGQTQEDNPPPGSAPAPAKRMSEEEALSVLGLDADPDAPSVRAAHRRLISQLHPDKGGTDYLAAKINEARDYLLARISED
ncbi:molecular chaperone DnaJ [Hyphococcus sp.]|uniref:molecular chaperone DnaJ n=1 Tax=Hyphococcus sp. TaxID=2038636 RepID=UPI003CCB9151